MLHGLECGQWPAELPALTGMGDGELRGGIQRTDDLHAAGPRAAADEFVCGGEAHRSEPIDRQIERERSAGFTGEVVPVDHL